MNPAHTLPEMYQKFGLSGVVILIGISLILFMGYEVSKYLIIRLIERYWPGLRPRKNPLKAIFFDKMSVLLYYKIPRFSVNCPLRRKIFTKMLRICFEVWRSEAQEKAVVQEVDKLDSEKYLNFWKNFVFNTTAKWEDEAVKQGIPEIAVFKYRDIHQKNLIIIENVVEQICSSVDVYRSNAERTIAILDFMAILLDMALMDAEKTVMQLNGELSEIEFEGVKCEDCDNGNCEHRAEVDSNK